VQRLTLIPVATVRAAFWPVSGATGVCLEAADRGLKQAHTSTTG